ncbi:hypothetical protein, partial [Mucilaginibacter sp. OK098]|uniref:hypothetical protein n=1 Tax=Mucilaginibacter sp. OK098 TaxID=1855297 RepID=UPI0009167B4B
MKTSLPSSKNFFPALIFIEKLGLAIFMALFCFNNLYAGANASPEYKSNRIGRPGKKNAAIIKGSNQFGVPFISYISPQTYVAGTAIAVLSPTIGGGAAGAPAYSSSTTTLGSGFNIPAGIAVDAAGNIYIG